MSGRTDRQGSWGSRPDVVIAEAKAAARRALRQKHPRLTALEPSTSALKRSCDRKREPDSTQAAEEKIQEAT